jgi:endoglucanase
VCTSPASRSTGRFVHIEQDPGFRSSSDWLQPVIDTWPAPAPLPPVTLTPTKDAYVRGGSHASTNHGTSTALHAKVDLDSSSNQRRAFLRFDLSSVATVVSAKLRIFASLSSTTDPKPGLSVFAVADTTWGETSITYDNMPAMGTELGSVAVSSTRHSWKEIDVTSYVQAEKAAGRNQITLGLSGSVDSFGYVQAFSREASAANRPQLVIQP